MKKIFIPILILIIFQFCAREDISDTRFGQDGTGNFWLLKFREVSGSLKIKI